MVMATSRDGFKFSRLEKVDQKRCVISMDVERGSKKNDQMASIIIIYDFENGKIVDWKETSTKVS